MKKLINMIIVLGVLLLLSIGTGTVLYYRWQQAEIKAKNAESGMDVLKAQIQVLEAREAELYKKLDSIQARKPKIQIKYKTIQQKIPVLTMPEMVGMYSEYVDDTILCLEVSPGDSLLCFTREQNWMLLNNYVGYRECEELRELDAEQITLLYEVIKNKEEMMDSRIKLASEQLEQSTRETGYWKKRARVERTQKWLSVAGNVLLGVLYLTK